MTRKYRRDTLKPGWWNPNQPVVSSPKQGKQYMAENYGWTVFGRHYHKVVGRNYFQPVAKCGISLDQSVYEVPNGNETGAMVPEDLKPCKRCGL